MGVTKIQWCDYTFNPWIGCSMALVPVDGKLQVVQECIHCYAKATDDRRFSRTLGGGTKEHPISHWGKGAPRYRTRQENWRDPMKWNNLAYSFAECLKCGWRGDRSTPKRSTDSVIHCPQCDTLGSLRSGKEIRPRVFCLSLGDWLDDEVPIDWLADLLRLINDTPNLDWLLLTKRPQNWESRIFEAMMLAIGRKDSVLRGMLDRWYYYISNGSSDIRTPPPNVWIGVSAGADQKSALEIPSKVHFLSCEPMLQKLDETHARQFDWIIFGGESGKKARTCNVDWIHEGIRFCRKHGVTPFVKQLGSNPKYTAAGIDYGSKDGRGNIRRYMNDPKWMVSYNNPANRSAKITDSHGDDMTEWPEDLRVREFPKTLQTT